MADITWINWSALEEKIPLDELPSFHRSFLQLAKPAREGGDDWDNTFLRKVQGNVQATLKQLEREGRMKEVDGKLLIDKKLIPDEFQQFIDDSSTE